MSFWVPALLSYTNDILKTGFKAVGLEQNGEYFLDAKYGLMTIKLGNIPWSHGLFMSVVWSVLASVVIYLLLRDRRTAILMGLVVLSHWILDFITHPPELPLLFNNSIKVGLGLSLTNEGFLLSYLIEIAMLLGTLAIYLHRLHAKIAQTN